MGAWERRSEFWAAMYANEDRELPDGHFSWSSWD